MNTFFTADTHFGHANIIKYCQRPQYDESDFDSQGEWLSKSMAGRRVYDMDSFLISKWNEIVTNKDDVFHLGDFCFGLRNDAIRYLSELQFGTFNFIWGNHDRGMEDLYRALRDNRVPHFVRNKVRFLGGLKEVKVERQRIVLCHYAMRVWDKSHHGSWHLYGHSHGSLPDDPNALSIDVGVDVHGYRPISFDEVAMYMAKKTFKPIDHHGN